MGAKGCSLCGMLGWVLDSSDVNRPSPRMVELIACPIPDCEASGQPLQAVVFKGVRFTHASLHPSERYVMSVSGGAEGHPPRKEEGKS